MGNGPHARDVFCVGEGVVFLYDGSLIGGEVDRLYVGAVFFQGGVHPKLHGGVLSEDQAFGGDRVLFEEGEEVRDVVAAVGGGGLQVVGGEGVFFFQVGLEDLGFGEGGGVEAGQGGFGGFPQGGGGVAYAAYDQVGFGDVVFHGVGEDVPAFQDGAAEKDHGVGLAEAETVLQRALGKLRYVAPAEEAAEDVYAIREHGG